MSRIITIASAKGGVGKSTIALNLATALTKMGHHALAVDANLSSPTLATHLGMPQPERHIHGILAGAYPLDHAVYRHTASGATLIPGSINLHHALDTPTTLTHLASGLRTHFPYTLIDSAAGLHDESSAALTLGDEIIVITTPDLPGVIAARKTIELARKLGKPAAIIINQVKTHNDIEPEDIPGLVRAPLLGAIPHDLLIPYSQTIHQPLVHSHPDSSAGRALLRLARTILTP